MIDPELLKILCCPETHQPLSESSPEAVAKLNQQIAAGQVRNRRGDVVKEAVDGGLVRSDGKFLYVIRQDIPVLLIDEGIPIG